MGILKVQLTSQFYNNTPHLKLQPPELSRLSRLNQGPPHGDRFGTTVARDIQPYGKSFYPVMPQTAIRWQFGESLDYLAKLLPGGQRQLSQILEDRQDVPSPLAAAGVTSSKWLQESKIVGLNPRAIGTFWDIVKYAMTLPEDAIHILPLHEPGYGESLYARVNWQLNDEFLDPDLAARGFTTPEAQLKLVTNVLHAMGKKVGMDAVPHTDRFSEEVFAYPDYFEWIHLNADQTAILPFAPENPEGTGTYDQVKSVIFNFVAENGPAIPLPPDVSLSRETFFNDEVVPENLRYRILFGEPANKQQRLDRRVALLQLMQKKGFITAPVVDGPPYRPFKLAPNTHTAHTELIVHDELTDRSPKGITGTLAPYRVFQLQADGSLNYDLADLNVLKYFARQLKAMQQAYNFDFIRADMSHIQMRAEGPMEPIRPGLPENKMELWAYLKYQLQKQAPYFATLSEDFLISDDICGYGNSRQNNHARNVDVVLGNVANQPLVASPGILSSPLDIQHIKHHYNIIGNLSFRPSIAMFTTDSDNPKMNFLHNNTVNIIRAVLGYFLNNPSYMGAGFEVLEERPLPTMSEQGKLLEIENPRKYSRYYIAQPSFLNYRTQPYQWGENHTFHQTMTRLRKVYVQLQDKLKTLGHWWVDTDKAAVGAWTYYDKNTKQPELLFVVNTDHRAHEDQVIVDNPFDTL